MPLKFLGTYTHVHHSTLKPAHLNSQVVDALLGLVSSFLLAIITDRALLVEWTDKWATPLDQLSLLGSQVRPALVPFLVTAVHVVEEKAIVVV